MKITDRYLNAGKLFGELKTGDIFRDSDGDIMMKIKPYPDEKTNCIDLKDGEGYVYDYDEEVTLITNAELIVG